jgi:heat shock protein HslJ
MNVHIRTACVALTLVAASCGAPTQEPPAADPSGYEGEWWLVSGSGPEGAITVPDGYEARMKIEANAVSGTAVCNHFSGGVEIDGHSFRAQAGQMTEMGCPGTAGEGEHAFISALLDANRIDRRGAELTLSGPETELRFSLHVPPPLPDLEQTRWRLNGLVEGRGSYGSVRSPTPAFLIFEPDGTLRGTTGCRRMTGEWERQDDLIEVTGLRTDGDCSQSDDRDQDEHILGVLTGTISAEISEQTLEVYQTTTDHGLLYTTGRR